MNDHSAYPHIPKTLSQGFSLLVLLHALLFLVFWLTNALFYADTNNYLEGLLGAPLDYIRICVVWAALTAAWSALRLVGERFKRLTWLYSILGTVFIVFFYGSYWMLFRESPVQAVRIRQMLGYFRSALDILVLAGLAIGLSAWLRQAGTGRSTLFGAIAVFLAAWLLPVFLPPGNVYSDSLPPKPQIIAHRGASMLAPENTLAAMQLAVQLGAYGLESDLHFSVDGALYLMHDNTLERTTDVTVRFPGREAQRAETFLLAEVRQLNAGGWFVDQDPYRTIAKRRITQEQAAAFTHQPVPTLAELLEVVRQSKTVFIFDLKQPPEDNPFKAQFFDLTFQEIKAAGIDRQIWFLVDSQQAQVLQNEAPDMQRVIGLNYRQPADPSDLLADGYQIVNAEYGLPPDWIARYRANGLWVNLYTVDEPWQFSRLWLLGVDSITTSNAGEMLTLTRPFLAIPYVTYVVLWILLGIIGLVLISGRLLP